MSGRRARRFQPDPEPTAEREWLERRWFRRMRAMPEIAELVTGAALRDEPRHRWLAYRQAFAPKLVRLFLAHAENLAADDDHPILDPFSGSGVTAVECAVRGAPAVGVEAVAGLAFFTRAKGATAFPELPSLRGCVTWQDYADRLELPVHRAALMSAVQRRHTTDGKPLRDPPALRETFEQVAQEMRTDVLSAIARAVDVRAGDARELAGIAPGSVAGVLTSPPYLSRHDYTRIARPLELVHEYWSAAESDLRDAQVRAHPRARADHRRGAGVTPVAPGEPDGGGRPVGAVVAECAAALELREHPRLAGVVRGYFADLAAVLSGLARAMRPGAPAWIVIGGARLEGVYIPSDIALASMAEECGFSVGALRVARQLASGRRLGRLDEVGPRETVVILRREAD